MVIRLEKNGKLTKVKLNVENPVGAVRIKRILKDLEVENPLITYRDDTQNSYSEKGSDIYNLAMMVWCAESGKMYSSANIITLFKNALTSLIRLEQEKEQHLMKAVSNYSELTPCLDFECDAPRFSVFTASDTAQSLWRNTKINFRKTVICGKTLSTEEKRFIEMISKNYTEISVNEFIQNMINLLWIQYTENKK